MHADQRLRPFVLQERGKRGGEPTFRRKGLPTPLCLQPRLAVLPHEKHALILPASAGPAWEQSGRMWGANVGRNEQSSRRHERRPPAPSGERSDSRKLRHRHFRCVTRSFCGVNWLQSPLCLPHPSDFIRIYSRHVSKQTPHTFPREMSGDSRAKQKEQQRWKLLLAWRTFRDRLFCTSVFVFALNLVPQFFTAVTAILLATQVL